MENVVCSFAQAAQRVNVSKCWCASNSMSSCVLWMTVLFPKVRNPSLSLSQPRSQPQKVSMSSFSG